MKLFTSTLITAAAALTLAGAAQAQVTVTTGGGYINLQVVKRSLKAQKRSRHFS